MLEFLIFGLGLGLDQLVKWWAMHSLSVMPDGIMPVIGNSFVLRYAENYGNTVSFFRSTHPVMYVFRFLQVLLALYILIGLRKKISKWTRAGLALFLAGLIGNQINYIFMGFVPDMFYIPRLINGIFNIADVLVLVSMIILFIRLAFFEGTVLIDWVLGKLGIKGDSKAKSKGKVEAASQNSDETNNEESDAKVSEIEPAAEAKEHD